VEATDEGIHIIISLQPSTSCSTVPIYYNPSSTAETKAREEEVEVTDDEAQSTTPSLFTTLQLYEQTLHPIILRNSTRF